MDKQDIFKFICLKKILNTILITSLYEKTDERGQNI
jgi:hypothetical protein